jgi:hypothetical protein
MSRSSVPPQRVAGPWQQPTVTSITALQTLMAIAHGRIRACAKNANKGAADLSEQKVSH